MLPERFPNSMFSISEYVYPVGHDCPPGHYSLCFECLNCRSKFDKIIDNSISMIHGSTEVYYIDPSTRETINIFCPLCQSEEVAKWDLPEDAPPYARKLEATRMRYRH